MPIPSKLLSVAETASNGPQIYGLLAKVAGDIGAVGKTGQNKQQGYKFRGVEAIMNALHPVLVKHGVLVIPQVQDERLTVRDRINASSGEIVGVTIHVRLTVRFLFLAPDGSSVEAVTIGEGADTNDKACNKAMSHAFKYAVSQVFCIPFGLEEGDDDSPEMGTQPSATPRAPESPARVAAPSGAVTITHLISTDTSNPNVKRTTVTFSDGQAFSTINDKLKAVALVNHQDKALVTYRTEKRGKFTNLIAIQRVTASAEWARGTDEDWSPDDEPAFDADGPSF